VVAVDFRPQVDNRLYFFLHLFVRTLLPLLFAVDSIAERFFAYVLEKADFVKLLGLRLHATALFKPVLFLDLGKIVLVFRYEG